MKIVFLSNYFNHHQKPFCDAMMKKTNGDFRFIAYEKLSEERIKMGYRVLVEDYVVEGDKKENSSLCDDWIENADAVIIGSAPWSAVQKRVKQKKLTFVYSERLYKNGCSPLRLLKSLIIFLKKYTFRKNVYCLAASAFTAHDYNLGLAFINKTFKWGYFPPTYRYDEGQLLEKKRHRYLSIVWCGRMIGLKHPEYPLQLAKELAEKKVDFRLFMIGTGPLFEQCREFVDQNGLKRFVCLPGSMSPEKVRRYMEFSNVFLFTSDRNEGWGAVLNEAMNSGCAVVAGSRIGSAPFLIKDGVNGLLYRDGVYRDFFEKTVRLIEDRGFCWKLGNEAYHTITDLWNADNAAKQFTALCESMISKTRIKLPEEGPCSKAPYLRDSWK
ncbi:MAG: glycosyltransferase [Clostridia bacterium]|nr:glycosyltransferase [Clostridia bacterium]